MSTPDRPKPALRPSSPRQSRPSLASAMGGLPRPLPHARPPSPRVMKPAPASPARPSSSKARSSQASKQASKPVSNIASVLSVAGRLGAFLPPRLETAKPPKGGGTRRR